MNDERLNIDKVLQDLKKVSPNYLAGIPKIHRDSYIESTWSLFPMRGHFRLGDQEGVERGWTRTPSALIPKRLLLLKQPSLEVHKLLRRKKSHLNLGRLFNNLAATVLQPVVSYDFGSAFRPTKKSLALVKQCGNLNQSSLASGSSSNSQHIILPLDGNFTLANIYAENPKVCRSGRSFTAYSPSFDSSCRFNVVPDDEASAMDDVDDVEVLADAVPFVRRQPLVDHVHGFELPEDSDYQKAMASECNANFISITDVAELTGDEKAKAVEAAVTPAQHFEAIMKLSEWAMSSRLARLDEAEAETQTQAQETSEEEYSRA
uniref:Uncharacterized protein n=1 Tax=Mycena chlorophos TaxID=658473 RepID=A0ABQ0KUR3_MYCCL|nr:predicted protein [Mycena chlorophos]